MPDISLFTPQNFIYAIALIFAVYEIYDKGSRYDTKFEEKEKYNNLTFKILLY